MAAGQGGVLGTPSPPQRSGFTHRIPSTHWHRPQQPWPGGGRRRRKRLAVVRPQPLALPAAGSGDRPHWAGPGQRSLHLPEPQGLGGAALPRQATAPRAGVGVGPRSPGERPLPHTATPTAAPEDGGGTGSRLTARRFLTHDHDFKGGFCRHILRSPVCQAGKTPAAPGSCRLTSLPLTRGRRG